MSTPALDLLTTAEAAETLRQPESTLRRWRATGYGPPYKKIGKRCLYKRADINRWYENQ